MVHSEMITANIRILHQYFLQNLHSTVFIFPTTRILRIALNLIEEIFKAPCSPENGNHVYAEKTIVNWYRIFRYANRTSLGDTAKSVYGKNTTLKRFFSRGLTQDLSLSKRSTVHKCSQFQSSLLHIYKES
jgi:hypothetical protein